MTAEARGLSEGATALAFADPTGRPAFSQWLLAGLVVSVAILAPLALGATGPLARFAVECAIAGVVLGWAVACSPSSRSLLPVAAIAAVGLVQSLSLPGRVTSPSSLSGEPGLTALAAQRGVLACLSMLAIATLARHAACWRWLASGAALSGGLVWLLGIAIPVRRDGQRVLLRSIDIGGPIDWWLTPLKEPRETAGFGYPIPMTAVGQRFTVMDWAIGDGFGPYVVSNHFAAAIYLTVPIAVALGLWWSRGKLHSALRFGLAAAVMAAAVWTVGVLAGSRAGAGALVLSCLVLTWLTLENRAARWIAGLAVGGYATAFLMFAAVLYGQFRGVEKMLPPGLQPKVAAMLSDPRTISTSAAWRLFREAPVWGIGLGTYGDAAAQRAGTGSYCYFAHNDYIQLLAETGLVGGIAAFLAGGWLAWLFIRFCRESRPPERILGAGAWAAVAGIAAHSAFDWNLHVPANAFLTCMVTGLAIATVAPRPLAQRLPGATGWTAFMGRLARWGVCLAVIGSMPMLLRDCLSDCTCRQLREAITAFRLAAKDPQTPPAWGELERAHVMGEWMARWDPANAKLSQLMGQTSLLMAVKPQPIDDVDEWMADVTKWFSKTRASSAVRLVPDDNPASHTP